MAIPTTYNDRLTGTKNGIADTIDGLAGLDTVSYDGNYADYTLKYDAGLFTIQDNNPTSQGDDGIDTLIGIEKILFLGDKKQVSLSTEAIVNAETGGEQTDTTVLKLKNGGFINFWYGKVMVTEKVVDPTTGAETEVTHETLGYYYRQYGADGVAKGLDQKIIADTDGTMSGFKPAILADDSITADDKISFAIAWSEPDADKNGISVQIFNIDDGTRSVKFRANDTLTDDQAQPSIAVLTDGSFVVAWTSANQGDALYNDGIQMGSPSNQSGVFAQHFDSSGNPLGWEMKISESGASDAYVSALNNGGYVIAYEGIAAVTKMMTITASFFDGNDNPVIVPNPDPNVPPSNSIDVNITQEDSRSQTPDPVYNELASQEKLPQIATLTNGSIVIVWQAPRDAYETGKTHLAHDTSIIARMFNQDGTEVTTAIGEIHVNYVDDNHLETIRYDQKQPAVAALSGPNGGYVVVWQSMLQDGSYWGVYGQRFDNDGNKVGEQFQVNTKVSDSQQNPSVVGLADGSFVVTWEAQYQDGNQQGSFQSGSTATEIVQQRYDANGNPQGMSVAGGNNDDTITITGSGNIEIAGGLGSDALTSGDGDDTLRGNDGNDILDAGKGNNVIIGGGGTDILKLVGEQADYTIDGSNGGHLIVGIKAASAGIRDYVSSVEAIQFLGSGLLYNLDSGQSGDPYGQPIDPGDEAGARYDDLYAHELDADLIDTIIGGNRTSSVEADLMRGGNGDDVYIARFGVYLNIYDTGGIDTLKEIASNIDLSHPELNKKTKGLQYIENVSLGGGKSNFYLTGNSGNNALTGNAGANKISGGAGNDIIEGGAGKDKLTGGLGVDRFVFSDPSKTNVDTIMDFGNNDIIRLKPGSFGGLDEDGDGKLDNDTQLVSGPGLKASNVGTDSFLIYDTNTGNLYYDAEGATPSVLIAKVGVYELDAKGNPTSVFHPAALTSSMFEILN